MKAYFVLVSLVFSAVTIAQTPQPQSPIQNYDKGSIFLGNEICPLMPLQIKFWQNVKQAFDSLRRNPALRCQTTSGIYLQPVERANVIYGLLENFANPADAGSVYTGASGYVFGRSAVDNLSLNCDNFESVVEFEYNTYLEALKTGYTPGVTSQVYGATVPDYQTCFRSVLDSKYRDNREACLKDMEDVRLRYMLSKCSASQEDVERATVRRTTRNYLETLDREFDLFFRSLDDVDPACRQSSKELVSSVLKDSLASSSVFLGLASGSELASVGVVLAGKYLSAFINSNKLERKMSKEMEAELQRTYSACLYFRGQQQALRCEEFRKVVQPSQPPERETVWWKYAVDVQEPGVYTISNLADLFREIIATPRLVQFYGSRPQENLESKTALIVRLERLMDAHFINPEDGKKILVIDHLNEIADALGRFVPRSGLLKKSADKMKRITRAYSSWKVSTEKGSAENATDFSELLLALKGGKLLGIIPDEDPSKSQPKVSTWDPIDLRETIRLYWMVRDRLSGGRTPSFLVNFEATMKQSEKYAEQVLQFHARSSAVGQKAAFSDVDTMFNTGAFVKWHRFQKGAFKNSINKVYEEAKSSVQDLAKSPQKSLEGNWAENSNIYESRKDFFNTKLLPLFQMCTYLASSFYYPENIKSLALSPTRTTESKEFEDTCAPFYCKDLGFVPPNLAQFREYQCAVGGGLNSLMKQNIVKEFASTGKICGYPLNIRFGRDMAEKLKAGSRAKANEPPLPIVEPRPTVGLVGFNFPNPVPPPQFSSSGTPWWAKKTESLVLKSYKKGYLLKGVQVDPELHAREVAQQYTRSNVMSRGSKITVKTDKENGESVYYVVLEGLDRADLATKRNECKRLALPPSNFGFSCSTRIF